MCGIAGALSRRPVEREVIGRMRDQVAHRGPDHSATWVSPDGRVALGHRRLSVIDPLPEGHQPFVSSDGRFVLVYNGEIYNHAELRRELQALGVPIRTRSDSEVLLESVRAWGADALDRFSGMFAFAIWDTVQRTLFCARDRAGEKPFYYARLPGVFLFGSEPKVFLAWPGFSRQLHYPAVIDYFAYGFVPDPKCIWESCAKLPPGHYLDVPTDPDGTPRPGPPRRWWDWRFEPDRRETDWSPRILGTLERAAREMTVADVPLGVFLSGGVDSSSVVAALARSGEPVKTFTVGFDQPSHDERSWARAVAERYRTDHHEKVMGIEEAESAFEMLLRHFDEPFSDESFLPTYQLARETRRQVTVALSGDGADETFAGYRKYCRMMRWAGRRGGLAGGLFRILGRLGLRPGAGVAEQYGDPSSVLTGILTRGPSRDLLAAHARGPLAEALRHYDPREALTDHLRAAPVEEVGWVNSLRYLDFKHTLAGDILVKVDRASMAVALEVRPVFLHRDMLRLAGAIPANLLADGKHSKEALKQAVSAWLPSGNIRRGKQGFLPPTESWLLNRRSGAPADPRLAELLSPGLLAGLLEQLRRGQARPRAVHQVLLLDRWMARWEPAG